jgi:tripartite-type tricarboxylate transporter receptor subunit TctC
MMGHAIRALPWFVLVMAGCHPASSLSFPAKPIKLVVYTGPGGLIDQTARKFTEIASRHCQATFVVENKPGAGGIVAMKKVLRSPADGYTLLACTKSNISKIVETGGDASVAAFDWIAMNMADPECVITRADTPLAEWSALLSDARQQAGQQLWVGPSLGGLDHVMAIKTWERAGIQAKWIPFKSGESAKAALLGGQGVAYVGNPQDAMGNDQLRVAAVSGSRRIPQFPDAPTFSELGIDGLEHEFMWRGFAVRKGCPPGVLAWYDDLFQKVNDDPDWRSYWEKRGIEVTYLSKAEFTNIVRQDLAEFSHHLKSIGLVHTDETAFGANVGGRGFLLGAVVFLVGSGLLAWMGLGRLIVPVGLAAICLLFVSISYSFPVTEGVGPGMVPRLWIVCLISLCGFQFVRETRKGAGTQRDSSSGMSSRPVAVFGTLMVLYVILMLFIGYFPSSFLFLCVAMSMLGVRDLRVMFGVTTGWLAFSYLLFVRVLYVPLPSGSLLETWFG